MKLRSAAILLSVFLSIPLRADLGDPVWLDAVEVSATVSGTTVTLSWLDDPTSNSETYTIYKKAFGGVSWGTALTTTSALSFNDSLAVGATAEYKIVKNTARPGYGYIYVGNKAPVITEDRGKVLLIVDNTYSTDSGLTTKLSRLEDDLRGDGWTVVRQNVARHDPAIPSRVTTVKNLITTENAAGNLKAVFLFGHVPIPYSGVTNNDGHADHTGAFPADVYYADVDGNWTDTSKNYGAYYPRQSNVPGDGKFDQDTIPSDADLMVGRVDLADMTCFNNPDDPPALKRDELALLKQYLDKDHNYRHKVWALRRRGLVVDEWGFHSNEGYGASAYRNFGPFFTPYMTGDMTNSNSAFWNEVSANSYLSTWCGGGGEFISCGSFGTTDQFQTYDPRVAFAMWFGSYFSDWDNESAFLRGPLGSTTYTVAAIWSGRPHWFMHHMGLGETIGYSTRLSQNNSTLYESAFNGYMRSIHISLLGDPTLRLHTVLPVTSLSGSASGSTVNLNWSASADSSVKGYYIYRASAATGPFVKQTAAPNTATTFSQSVANGTYYYMVRTIKLEGELNDETNRTGCGTYTNLSQGIVTSVVVGGGGGGGASATFVSQDSTTHGSWRNGYGADGYNVIGDAQSYPSYATVTGSGNNFYLWQDAPTDQGSLFRVTNPSQRIAATWYNASQFTITINVSGTVAKKVTLYCLDWDVLGRNETIVVEDAGTGQQLDSRPVTSFSGGVYFSWNVLGNVRFRIVNNASGLNAVVNGIFFGGPAGGGGSGNTATFVATDTTTQGTWRPGALVYGQDGYNVIGNAFAYPSYATVTPSGKADYTWADPTSDVRALQKAAPSPDRISSVWYSPAGASDFTVNLSISGGVAKRVALYFLDWDGTSGNHRNERVDIFDASTQTLLSSQSLTDFRQGTWLVWNINGSVIIKCVNVSGNNALLNGLFFGQ